MVSQARSYSGSRTVRLGDVTGSGRLRLDALARYLQDVATDDATDAGLAQGWVLRRMALRIESLPRFGEHVDLVTWCSGTGASAAERRTTLRVDGRVAVEAEALWVFVAADGRPTRLEPAFFEMYGLSANGRRVSTRLRHPDPPGGLRTRAWPLRAADVDVACHVNNAVSLAAVEDALAEAGRAEPALPWSVEVEYRTSIEPGDAPVLAWMHDAATLACWLLCEGHVCTSARMGSPVDAPVPA